MAKERLVLEELVQQQNQILQSISQSLRQRNVQPPVENKPASPVPEPQESFVEDLYRDEIRDGFLVTSHRKKLWNVQIGLINEFARICSKHNLRWFATDGTLLGAARHKGFIPWDDDVDLAMFRPDYEKFKRIAREELKYPYFLDNWYDYRLKEEDNLSPQDSQLPVVSVKPNRYPRFPLIKIRDCRTSQIQWPDRKNVNQGVWIDIFPFDVLPPFASKEQLMTFELARQLLLITIDPNLIRSAMENDKKLLFPKDKIESLLSMPFQKRGMRFDEFMLKNFFESQHIGQMRGQITKPPLKLTFKTKDFADVTYLPFEKIEVPAPANYDSALTDRYGNWHRMVFTPPHVQKYSADIPYEEYFKLVTR